MELRMLGGQGLVVSALGLGCMGMSESYAIEEVTPRGSAAGERYTPEHMANVDT